MHAKVFSIQILQYFRQIPLKVCTLVLFIALEKKGGWLGLAIAVGYTLRKLVAKIAGFRVLEDMMTLLAPRQLGYGIRGGAEAAIHATR